MRWDATSVSTCPQRGHSNCRALQSSEGSMAYLSWFALTPVAHDQPTSHY